MLRRSMIPVSRETTVLFSFPRFSGIIRTTE
jgi:hypothetical protein